MEVKTDERRIIISGGFPGDEMDVSRGEDHVCFELNGQFSLDIDLEAARLLRDWLTETLLSER